MVTLPAGLACACPASSAYSPYAEFNWWHNSSGNSVWLNQDNVTMDSQDNVYEVRLGVQGALTRNLHVWAEATAQQGSGDYNSYGGAIGLNYRW